MESVRQIVVCADSLMCLAWSVPRRTVKCRNLSRLAPQEAAVHGVRINSVHPGLTDTGMKRRFRGGRAAATSSPETEDLDGGETNAMGVSIPLGRWADGLPSILAAEAGPSPHHCLLSPSRC